MDPTVVTATILAMASILLGLNLFFLKNIITKVESSSNISMDNSVRLQLLSKQVEDFVKMRADLEVLRYAITGRLLDSDAIIRPLK